MNVVVNPCLRFLMNHIFVTWEQ